MKRHCLALSLLLVAAQPIAPAAACHVYKYWHFHTPQRCGSYVQHAYVQHAHSIRHPYRHSRMLAQVVRPPPTDAPPAKQGGEATRGVSPIVGAPKTERELGLDALREKMREPQQ